MAPCAACNARTPRRPVAIAILLVSSLMDACDAWSAGAGVSTRHVDSYRSTGVRMAAAKKKGKAAAKGFGRQAAAPAGPTASELLKQSTKVYEALDAHDDRGEERTPVTRWAVVMRSDALDALGDWVPVCVLAMRTERVVDPAALVPGALGARRREVFEAGCQLVAPLRKVPRDRVELGFEPLAEFESHVIDALGERAQRRREAADVLGVGAGASGAEVKKAHRKLVMQLHPDRFVNDPEGGAAALERMRAVTDAYEELGGGRGGDSWYEKIGGKMRVSFQSVGVVGKAHAEVWDAQAPAAGWAAGVFPIEDEIAQDYLQRNVIRAATATA